MAVIRIKVDGHLTQCVSVEPMATGSAGVDSVIIDRLGGGWEGFSLAAAFKTEAENTIPWWRASCPGGLSALTRGPCCFCRLRSRASGP